MPQIRTMRHADIPFAMKLTDQEEWGVTRSDLTRILSLDPRGSFIAKEGSRRVGLITTTQYGRELAWIGNVIVDKNDRGKHIGHHLVQRALEHLHNLRVEHIALYCFDDNVKFYGSLGFVRDIQFVRLQRKGKTSGIAAPAIHHWQKLPMHLVFASDRKAFGADRSKLIRMVLRTKAAWYVGSSNGPNAASYLLVKEFKDMSEFGPWVCIDPPNGQPREMLTLALARISGKPVEVSCLQHHPALALLRGNGFRTTRHGYRMYFRKVPRLGSPEANYALGFLDKG